MSRYPNDGEEKVDGIFTYGMTVSQVQESVTATSSTTAIITARVGHATGKKTILIFNTDSNGITYNVYGSMNPDASKSDIETDAEAGTTTKITLVDATDGTGTVTNGVAKIPTTDPWKWICVTIARSGGTDAAGNVYLSGS